MSADAIASALQATRSLAALASIIHQCPADEALQLAASVCALCAAAAAMEHVPAACFRAMAANIDALSPSPSVHAWVGLLLRSEPSMEGLSGETTIAFLDAIAVALRVTAAATSVGSQVDLVSGPAAFARQSVHSPELGAVVTVLLSWATKATDTIAAALGGCSPQDASVWASAAAALGTGALRAQDAAPNHFVAMNGLWKRVIVRCAAELIPSFLDVASQSHALKPAASSSAVFVATVLSRALFWADVALQGFVPFSRSSSITDARLESVGGAAACSRHPWAPASFELAAGSLLSASSGAAMRVNPWLRDPSCGKTLPVTLQFFLLQVRWVSSLCSPPHPRRNRKTQPRGGR
jgi:hypothetical protein